MAVRWNTGYYMIERINEQKIAIQQLLKDDDLKLYSTIEELTRNDFQLIESLIKVLEMCNR
jgi:hypothetical protein